MNSTTTPSGYWGGYFLKELTMDPLGMGWANCFRTHNELTMDPLGILVFAPSVECLELSPVSTSISNKFSIACDGITIRKVSRNMSLVESRAGALHRYDK